MGPMSAQRQGFWTPEEFAEQFDIDVEQARRDHAEARAKKEYQFVDRPGDPDAASDIA